MEVTNELLYAIIAAAVVIVICVGATIAYLRSVDTVTRKKIRAKLRPYAIAAIMHAYRASEAAIDEKQERLRGIDKAKIAQTVYNALPARIGGIPVGIVKVFISEVEFAKLVQDTFDRLDRLVDRAQARLDPD